MRTKWRTIHVFNGDYLMKQKYKLYLYDVWGNTKDGFEVNNIFAAQISLDGSIFNTENIIIEVSENDSDYQINRKIKCRAIEWECFNEDEIFYGSNKTNGKPFGELRPCSQTA